jgi:thymidylate kinase
MELQKEQEQFFEEKAQNILRYLKKHIRHDEKFLPRPFFIEFTGSPSSGKTTTITELDKFLRRQGFRVLRPQEGAEVIRHVERTTPLYNIRTGMYALEILIDLSMGHLYDAVIFDRCLFDAYCWLKYWKEKGELSHEEKTMFQSFFLSRFFIDKLDAVYFMITNPEIAMERELRIALSTKLGETTNPKTVETLVERYRSAYHLLSPHHPQLRLIDTSMLEEQAMVEHIARDILNILETKAKSGL